MDTRELRLLNSMLDHPARNTEEESERFIYSVMQSSRIPPRRIIDHRTLKKVWSSGEKEMVRKETIIEAMKILDDATLKPRHYICYHHGVIDCERCAKEIAIA